MIYILLAEGFEETEALVTFDMLKRANLSVQLVSITEDKTVKGSHGISINCDITEKEMVLEEMEMLVLPGGKQGVDNLDEFIRIDDIINYTRDKNRYFAAICAAPSIIGKRSVLEGKKATCYPGFEKYLLGAKIVAKKAVVDGKAITANGAGSVFEFFFAIIEELCGKDAVKKIKNDIRF